MKNYLRPVVIFFLLALMTGVLILSTPKAKKLNENEIFDAASKYDARIIRDTYGVPHIFGETDADATFGFGYAHAEDDWETIQDVLISARGMSSQYKGRATVATDYLFDLFKVKEAVERKYDTHINTDTKAVIKAYADAINLFGLENKDRVLDGVLPVTEADIVAGFTWATPFFYRLDGQLEDLFTSENKPEVSPWQQQSNMNLPEAVRGSNGFAIAPIRSDDKHTRLMVNSHQPMNGPYAWYEAHVVSKNMNFAGATFPGTPILVQGVSPDLGWTQTVNAPDLVDIYSLEVDNVNRPTKYKLDGKWNKFEKSWSTFRVKIWGPFSFPIIRSIIWSAHGPVLKTPTGVYAIRFSGLQEVGAIQQWYDMSKAKNIDEWKKAISQNGVLSFNITYADKEGNIGEVYNARMPKRIEGVDWTKHLPGNTSELIWDKYLSTDKLPQLWNPSCGWLFSANSTPFKITDPVCNNNRSDYSNTMGIEERFTNRARRSLALFSSDSEISESDLLKYRADTFYDTNSELMNLVKFLVNTVTKDPLVIEAQQVLNEWDGDTKKESRGAALAVITGMRTLGYEYIKNEQEPIEMLIKTAKELKERYGRIDPQWGEINRIQRGDYDLPLDGAPDILRAIYADRDGISKNGVMNAFAGDTHIMYADWDTEGVLDLKSIHQYGSATLDSSSEHYDDQVKMFTNGEYKNMPMYLEDVLKVKTRDYRPGKR
ncbi:MAG: penicillin acylase family protein [Hellea sp.]|nr:penicillin acylase family protein [Hellea sp.]MDG2362144.1 penicillin acylase family protein [Hellea sp.]